MNNYLPLPIVLINYLSNYGPINRLHLAPLSSKGHIYAITVLSLRPEGRNCSAFFGRAALGLIGLTVGVVTSCIAIAETVASLAYATLATLVHLLTRCRSPLYQNHVIKAWAFCLQSFMMIWTPISAWYNRISLLEDTLIENYDKISCARIVQYLGKFFDNIAGRDRINGVERYTFRQVEVMIEGLNRIVNNESIRLSLNEVRDPLSQELLFPHQLRPMSQSELISFLLQHRNQRNEFDLNAFFTRRFSYSFFKNKLEDLVHSMLLYQRHNRIVERGNRFEPQVKVAKRPVEIRPDFAALHAVTSMIIDPTQATRLESMDASLPAINYLARGDYDHSYIQYIQKAVKAIITIPEYTPLFHLECDDPLNHRRNVIDGITDLTHLNQVLRLAQFIELVEISQGRAQLCEDYELLDRGARNGERRINSLASAVIAFGEIKNNKEDKETLIRWILQDGRGNEANPRLEAIYNLIYKLANPLQRNVSFTQVIANTGNFYANQQQ